MYYFNLFSKTDLTFQGEVLVLPYAARLTDAMNSYHDDFIEFNPLGMEIGDVEVVGDKAVMFWVNPETIGYRFQKYNFIAEIHLTNKGMESRRAAVEIARAVVDNLQAPQISDTPGSDDPLEQQFLQCFPAQGELGFELPLYRYSTFSQLTGTGFVYKTRYTARVGGVNTTDFSLDVHIYVYHTPITGQDIRKHFENEVQIEQIGDYTYAEHRQRDTSPANFTSVVYVVKGPLMLQLRVIEKEDKETTLENLASLARQMNACLPEDPVLPQGIYLPEMPDSTPIQNDYVQVTGISNLSERVEALNMNLPAVEYRDSGLPRVLTIYAARELPLPLTFALYSPKYDLYSYRKQEGALRQGGQQNVGLFMIDLAEGQVYEYLALGEIELRIWMGDELLAVYPFYIGNWD